MRKGTKPVDHLSYIALSSRVIDKYTLPIALTREAPVVTEVLVFFLSKEMSFCSDSFTMLKSDLGSMWFCNVAMHPIALTGEALVATEVLFYFFQKKCLFAQILLQC